MFDTVPYRKRASIGVGEPEARADSRTATGTADSFGFGVLETDDAARRGARGRARRALAAGAARRPLDLRDGRQSVLQPACPATGDVSAARRLRAAGGSAARRRAADSGDGAAEARRFRGWSFVGSAYSYLQEWLPHVGQHAVREGLDDFVGLGRIALSYPDLPADVLAGAPLKRALFCRTFSDCTTGPRMGLVSGCYPLDKFYAARPEAAKIREVRVHEMGSGLGIRIRD